MQEKYDSNTEDGDDESDASKDRSEDVMNEESESLDNAGSLEDMTDIRLQEQDRPEKSETESTTQCPLEDSSDPAPCPDTDFQQFRPFPPPCTSRKDFEALEKRLQNFEVLVEQVDMNTTPYTFSCRQNTWHAARQLTSDTSYG